MQHLYPGDYIINETYNPSLGTFDFNIIFEDSNKELMWKMRYS